MENKCFDKVISKLKENSQECKKVLVGFDGFVDEIIYVVDKRYDHQTYKRLEYLDDYGKKISAAAGLSLNVEMLPIQKKIGGNGPIMANSLSNLGVSVTYIGALGADEVHPVFRSMQERIETISVSDSGFTDAIEFLDGKLISCKLEGLKGVTWENIKNKISPPELAKRIDECDCIGFVDWTLVVHTTAVWQGIITEVFPLLKNHNKRKLMVDLADPEKRTPEDIIEAIKCVEKFEEKFEVILGLNEKEANEIADLYDIPKGQERELLAMTKAIAKKVKVTTVVVHPVKSACAVSGEEIAIIDGPYCKVPKLTTGAGDNFNAGFLYAQMNKFDLQESLTIGCANSGYYVREGNSPDTNKIINFIVDWSQSKV